MSAVDRLIREVKREVRSMCVEVNGKLEDAILVSDFDRIADDYTERTKKAISKFRKSKPCAPKRVVDGVIIYDDDRERCDASKAGRREYHHRTIQMLNRQNHICVWCGEFLADNEATFDHELGRNAMFIDERIEVNGKIQNAALHCHCNEEKGSRRVPYPYQAQRKDGTQ